MMFILLFEVVKLVLEIGFIFFKSVELVLEGFY
jgi:hypothetical protein